MRVFYYRWTDGKTYLICARGGIPARLSPIWEHCNASSWMVPGTNDAEGGITPLETPLWEALGRKGDRTGGNSEGGPS